MLTPSSDSSSSVPSVLVVDDNPRNLQLMSAVLKQQGYKLYITNSGENALTFLENTLPDVILLDIMMPGLSGYDVCRIIKKQPRFKDIPVIFLTAKNEVDDIVEGFEAGAVDYIVKPFHAKEVYVRVATHLQLKQAREQLEVKNQELEELNKSLGLSKAIIEADAQQLLQLNAEKNKFFSIIAHDLRGPISGLSRITEILYNQFDKLSPTEVKETVNLMYNSSKQVMDLLFNLLEWSRLQMNAVTFNPENVNLKKIFLEIIRVFRTNIDAKNLEIAINMDPDIEVFADLNMLKTIIRNLVSNAIKFTPENGAVTLSAKTLLDTKVRIAISDSGIGMNQDLVDKLFKLDQRVSRPGTSGETSNGIGLLLCHDMVNRQGGEIRVESREGEGSTFWFTLTGKMESMME